MISGLAITTMSRLVKPYTKGHGHVLGVIIVFFDRQDRPSIMRKPADKLKCHVETVHQYILELERRGYFARERGRIRMVPEVRLMRAIRIVGQVGPAWKQLSDQLTTRPFRRQLSCDRLGWSRALGWEVEAVRSGDR